jgi:hypothetical protein
VATPASEEYLMRSVTRPANGKGLAKLDRGRVRYRWSDDGTLYATWTTES